MSSSESVCFWKFLLSHVINSLNFTLLLHIDRFLPIWNKLFSPYKWKVFSSEKDNKQQVQSRTGTIVSKEASISHFSSGRTNSFLIRKYSYYLLFRRVTVPIWTTPTMQVSLSWCIQDLIWSESILIIFKS